MGGIAARAEGSGAVLGVSTVYVSRGNEPWRTPRRAGPPWRGRWICDRWCSVFGLDWGSVVCVIGLGSFGFLELCELGGGDVVVAVVDGVEGFAGRVSSVEALAERAGGWFGSKRARVAVRNRVFGAVGGGRRRMLVTVAVTRDGCGRVRCSRRARPARDHAVGGRDWNESSASGFADPCRGQLLEGA